MNQGLRRLLDALAPYLVRKTAKGWLHRCPAHADRSPSLDVDEGDNGSPLVRCRAGCLSDAVLAAVGLSWAEVLRDDETVSLSRSVALKTTTTYEVCNRAGDVVALHIRTDKPDGSKGFTWRRPGGLPGLGGVPVVSLPLFGAELLDGEDGPVYLVEGEKAAVSLRTLGVLALGTVTGASSTPSAETLADLIGRDVILWPDNDVEESKGPAHMARISERLQNVAKSVRTIRWGTENGDDGADFVAKGGTMPDLEGLLAESLRAGETSKSPGLSICLADVEAEALSWLWPGRLLFRKFNLLDGDPDLGKTTITIDIAARFSRGRPMPFESEGREPGNVLYVLVEDGLGDTVRPRFEAAGGDPQRFFAIDTVETPIAFPEDAERIAEEAERRAAKLIIIETLTACLSSKIDTNKDANVRRALVPLRGIAERTGAAVWGVRHMNKQQGGNVLYRGGGSIAFTAAARSVSLVAKDPEDESRRVFAVYKGNLAAHPPALAYRIEGARTTGGIETSRIEWLGTSDHSPALLMAAAQEPEEQTATEEAVAFLEERLSAGALPAKDIQREAREVGISGRTLQRGSKRLGVVKRKAGFGGGWAWSLPLEVAEGGQDGPKVSAPGSVDTFGNLGHLRERSEPRNAGA